MLLIIESNFIVPRKAQKDSMALREMNLTKSPTALKINMQKAQAIWLLVLSLSSVVLASLEARGTNDNACNRGIYAEVANALKSHPPAQSFCAAAYPIKCTVKQKRSPPGSTTTSSSVIPKAQATATTTQAAAGSPRPGDTKAAAWSQVLKQGRDFVSTLCSCLQPPKASFH